MTDTDRWTNVRLDSDVHARLVDVSPDGETLSRTVDRGLDALEQRDMGPEDVREAVKEAMDE